MLAARFAAIFLGTELLLKLLPLFIAFLVDRVDKPSSSSTGLSSDQIIISIVYSVCAIVSAMAISYIDDLGLDVSSDENVEPAGPTDERTSGLLAKVAKGQNSSYNAGLMDKIASAIGLWRRRPEVLLLAPVQILFSFCASLLGVKVSGEILPQLFINNEIIVGSLLSALVSFTAAAFQFPFKVTSSRFGKSPVMVSGMIAFCCLGLIVFCGAAGSMAPFVICYVLQGVGRACYEGVNKALYADLFPEDAPAAFSNIVLANGLASAFAYFAMPSMNLVSSSSLVLSSGALSLLCYFFLLAKCKRTQKEEE